MMRFAGWRLVFQSYLHIAKISRLFASTTTVCEQFMITHQCTTYFKHTTELILILSDFR